MIYNEYAMLQDYNYDFPLHWQDPQLVEKAEINKGIIRETIALIFSEIVPSLKSTPRLA